MEIETRQCLCSEPQCSKCLAGNCEDKNCTIHTREAKKGWQRRWEVSNKKPWSGPKNY